MREGCGFSPLLGKKGTPQKITRGVVCGVRKEKLTKKESGLLEQGAPACVVLFQGSERESDATISHTHTHTHSHTERTRTQ